jgi:hypothetical protein
MKTSRKWSKTVVKCSIIILIINIVLAIWIGKRNLVTMTTGQYLLLIQDNIIKWTGFLTWGMAILWGLIALFRGRPLKLMSYSKLIEDSFGRFWKNLHRTVVSIPILIFLLGIMFYFLMQFKDERLYIPQSSTVLIPQNIGDSKSPSDLMYILHSHGVRNVLYELNYRQVYSDHLKSQNYRIKHTFGDGHPLMMAIAPERNEIYVTVEGGQTGTVVVLDINQLGGTEKNIILVGKKPRWISITPDERKAYVSNQEPIPQGSISVIDLSLQKVIKTIKGVNCPEGSVISPDGKRLYVSSQCAAERDPLFIIDTATDEIISQITDLPVGGALIITPDGEKIFGSFGSYLTRDEITNTTAFVPSRICVISTEKEKVIKEFDLDANAFAITADGKYILAAGYRWLTIIDTQKNEVIGKKIQLSSPPTGLAISNDNNLYVWLPEEPRLFISSLGGILDSK